MNCIAVFGLGYVGSVNAACLSRDGYRVFGVDIDPHKTDAINAGRSPVYEPGLSELISQQVSAGRLVATTDFPLAVRESQLALITVGSPSRSDGSLNSSSVVRVVKQILSLLDKDEYYIVVRSTLLPGVLEEEVNPLVAEYEALHPGKKVYLCNNPEFLRESTALSDYDNPSLIVVGEQEPGTGQSVLDLYSRVPGERIVTDTRTAAMVKYACNAFHALKVAFANEIGTLSAHVGADGHQVMDLLCRDKKLNISAAYLRPGFAFGGSCLPKDLRALTRLAQQRAIDVPLISAILPSNHAHWLRALQRVQSYGFRRIGLVGLSFKACTDDLRESPMVLLAEALLGTGYDLVIYDPWVSQSRLIGSNRAYVDQHLPHLGRLLVKTLEELIEHSELIILGTQDQVLRDHLGSYQHSILDLNRELASPSEFAYT